VRISDWTQATSKRRNARLGSKIQDELGKKIPSEATKSNFGPVSKQQKVVSNTSP
jgi:hypothetical protein